MGKLAAAAAALALLTGASAAHATTYTLWIHGRITDLGSGCSGATPSGWQYWGEVGTGVNPIAVNWNARNYISAADSNGAVREYLAAYCTGENSCYVLAHSAGAAQIAYAVDKCNVAGSCTNSGPYNIKWVDDVGGAEGGSEIADFGSWATGDCITQDLKTSAMRALYDHDALGNRILGRPYTFQGAKWSFLTQPIFAWGGVGRSENDSVVAYHSTGRARAVGAYNHANMAAQPLWNFTQVYFLDTGRARDHYVSGIVSVAREDMAASAL